MRRALFIAAALVLVVLVVPASAFAATLTMPRAERAALAEAQDRADQEQNGRGVTVSSCARRNRRTVLCRVAWEYTEEFDRRSGVDCTSRDEICTQQPENRWAGQDRKCTATVKVRYVSPRRTRVSAVLLGQACRPFFEREGGGPQPGAGGDSDNDSSSGDQPGSRPTTGSGSSQN